jgi:uncharacterized protein (DUF2062 family)
VIASDLWQKKELQTYWPNSVPSCVITVQIACIFTAVLTYSLNIDIHQRSVMPLKANEDARVKKKACNTDIEEEITGF